MMDFYSDSDDPTSPFHAPLTTKGLLLVFGEARSVPLSGHTRMCSLLNFMGCLFGQYLSFLALPGFRLPTDVFPAVSNMGVAIAPQQKSHWGNPTRLPPALSPWRIPLCSRDCSNGAQCGYPIAPPFSLWLCLPADPLALSSQSRVSLCSGGRFCGL
jgi:hypothetical protein